MEKDRIRAILVDDEPHCLEMLAWELERNCPEVEVLHQCATGKCGLKAIRDYQPELIFLDIDMPYLNGFEMLELVDDPQFQVIFTTAYDEFALKAFQISAVDYLLKPVDGADLQRAIKRYLDRRPAGHHSQVPELLQTLQQPERRTVNRVAFPTSEGIEFMDPTEIIYCMSEGNYCHLFLENRENLLISKTLKEVEAVLPENRFLRVHQSYLVQLDKVKSYQRTDGGQLFMSNGDTVRISRAKRDIFLKFFS